MVAERGFSACIDYAPVPAGLFKSLPTQVGRLTKDRYSAVCRVREVSSYKFSKSLHGALAASHPDCRWIKYDCIP
ncbi:hypothetical protein J6590_058842 [Homalodisca vitripennis]|nr:hypothetical protein J6590_058842 [Homalodisca vitripennis]